MPDDKGFGLSLCGFYWIEVRQRPKPVTKKHQPNSHLPTRLNIRITNWRQLRQTSSKTKLSKIFPNLPSVALATRWYSKPNFVPSWQQAYIDNIAILIYSLYIVELTNTIVFLAYIVLLITLCWTRCWLLIHLWLCLQGSLMRTWSEHAITHIKCFFLFWERQFEYIW